MFQSRNKVNRELVILLSFHHSKNNKYPLVHNDINNWIKTSKKEEKSWASCAWKFQITYIVTPPSRMWIITPHPLSVGSASWLPSKEYSMKIGGKSSLTLENSNTASTWWPRSTSDHVDNVYPCCDVMKWHFTLWFSSPNPIKPKPIMRNTSDKSQLHDILQTTIKFLIKTLAPRRLERDPDSSKVRGNWIHYPTNASL